MNKLICIAQRKDVRRVSRKSALRYIAAGWHYTRKAVYHRKMAEQWKVEEKALFYRLRQAEAKMRAGRANEALLSRRAG